MKRIQYFLLVFLLCAAGICADEYEELRENFQGRLDAAEAERELALHRLGQQYTEQLDRLFDQARQAANLEAARAVQLEIQRFREEGGMDTTETGIPVVQDLQTRYLDAAFLIEREEARTIVRLTLQFDQLLHELERQLTSENRIDEAIEVRAQRQALTETDAFQNTRRLAEATGRFAVPLHTDGEWRTPPVTFASRANAEGEIDEDGVIVVRGPLSRDRYLLELEPTEQLLTAVRLEAFSDPDLPSGGPGRAPNGNFVLNQILLEHVKADGESARVSFSEARSDFSQERWPVANAIDGRNDSGWGIFPRRGRDHTAVFVLESPLRVNAGDQLRIHMVHAYHDGRHNIGKFRLSTTSAEP